MGPILDWPTWDEFLVELLRLLHLTAQWLLTSWFGLPILVTTMVIFVAIISGSFGVKDPTNIEQN